MKSRMELPEFERKPLHDDSDERHDEQMEDEARERDEAEAAQEAEDRHQYEQERDQ